MPRAIQLIAGLAFVSLVAIDLPVTEAAESRSESFTGRAYSLDSDQLLYIEEHKQHLGADGKPLKMKSVYRNPEGQVWARRSVDYTAGDASAPAFELSDERHGYREGLSYGEDGQLELFVKPISGDRESIALQPDELQIADAGFDVFVRENWDTLTSGEKMRVEFAVPDRQNVYECNLHLVRDEQIRGEPVYTFRLKPAGLLAGMFADPVDVSYHRNSRVLMRYVGISNLRDKDGENYAVRIEFPLNERVSEASEAQS